MEHTLQKTSGAETEFPHSPAPRLRWKLALGRTRLNRRMFWNAVKGGHAADLISSHTRPFSEGRPPTTVGIEFTNACQLRCPYCDAQHPRIRRASGLMSEATFENVRDQLRALRVRNIRVIGGGEATLHPSFAQWIRLLRPLAPFLAVATNGQRLTGEICGAMLQAVDVVEISVDSDHAAGYEQSRIGGRFEVLLSGLERLRRMKAELRSKTLLHIRLMLRPSDHPTRFQMMEFWSRFADTLSTQMLKDYFGAGGDLFALDRSLEVPRCVVPFKTIGVNWNGDVPLCHASAYQTGNPRGLLLGNVNCETLASMWRGSLIRQYRQGHRRRCPGLVPICRGCADAWSPRLLGKVYEGRVAPAVSSALFRIL